LGAKSFGETLFVEQDTDQAQVFGKNGRELLPIKIRSNAIRFVKDCRQKPRKIKAGAVRIGAAGLV
jgi:hypothetical protein